MARRRVGSNQYKTRWGQDLPAPDRDLAVPEDPPERLRRGEVWGGRCRAWVEPPTWSHGDHPAKQGRQDRAQDPGCPLWLLQHLARDPEPWVRQRVAEHPACPPAVLQQLARDPDPGVRQRVAEHPACPPAVLQHLARDPEWQVREREAQHPACPPAVLQHLARDPEWWVRWEVAEHPACPPGALAQLARDPEGGGAGRSSGQPRPPSALAGP